MTHNSAPPNSTVPQPSRTKVGSSRSRTSDLLRATPAPIRPRQIAQIAASIRRFGFAAPILIGDDSAILAGHGRCAAARSLGMESAPTIRLSHLSPEERRAYAIADNRLAELAGWDAELLALELQELAAIDLDFDLEITGFDGAKLDDLLGITIEPELDPKADQVIEPQDVRSPAPATSGASAITASSAPTPETRQLPAPDDGRAGSDDVHRPPYNVRIVGNVGGKGRSRRREFVMASGEMRSQEFTAFLTNRSAQLPRQARTARSTTCAWTGGTCPRCGGRRGGLC